MSKTFSKCFLKLVCGILLLPAFHHATAQIVPARPAAPAKKSPAPPPRPAKPQELVVPFWTLEPGWATHLELRNNLASGDLDVTPVLRTSDGTELPLPPVKLGSDRAHHVDLHSAASSLSGRSGSYGSLVLRFTSTSPYNVYAAVMVQRLGHAITFHFDAFPVFQNFSSGSRETIWWLPQPTSDGFLVISNFDSKPVRARQTFTGNKAQYSTDLTLAPHQTQRISVRNTVRHAGFTAAEGGIKLDFESGAGSVFVAEVLFDETANFFEIHHSGLLGGYLTKVKGNLSSRSGTLPALHSKAFRQMPIGQMLKSPTPDGSVI